DGFVKTVESQGISDGADHYAQCKKLARKHVKLPAKLKGPPKVDVDEPARALMTLWHDGKFKDLFEAAHPELQQSIETPEAFERLSRMFSARAGKFVKIGVPLEHTITDSSY